MAADLLSRFTKTSTTTYADQMMIAIQSVTTTRSDGKVQSYCGMKLIQNRPTDNGASTSQTKTRVFCDASKSKNVEIDYYNIGPPSHQCPHCNATMWYEERVIKSKKSANPTFSLCCQEGKVKLQKLQTTPMPLRRLLEYNNNSSANRFQQNIRIYNAMFCFTSFGAQVDKSVNQGGGPYTFRISGQNFHKMGSLMPVEGGRPVYAQLYFYDTTNEIANRLSVIPHQEGEVDVEIVQELIEMLDKHSCVAKAFRMTRDWCEENNPTDLKLHLLGERQPSARQYNMPTVSEVAALVVGDFGESTGIRDIVINSKACGLQRISELHPLYMALQYPLLFPYGEDGFHEKIVYHNNTGKRSTKREFVTMKEYYSYRIQQRPDEDSTLLRGGRLTQGYLVDAYTGMEEQRLRWIQNNQDDLRADVYQNICDAVTRGDTKATSVGKRIVLPSTFTGSPRYMIQNYQDAMAICRALGNPDLFITFTANPKWPEIGGMLSQIPGQRPSERPEVMARIFKIKLAHLMKDIEKEGIFGKTNAAVYTIEFQKRELPHAHILVWLKEEAKCKTPRDLDDIICAEIPSQETDPRAYKIVTECMLHGPCGEANKSAPCMVDGTCSRHFPRAFYAETTIDEDGFPVYQRRDNGVHVKRGKTTLDNRFVVPYNRYLLLKYHAHINIEWCNRSRAIKYLFKYLNKGPDRATIVIDGSKVPRRNGSMGEEHQQTIEVDEIKQYQDCRYLAPCEAAWRIFGFPINYCNPSIIRLAFHLPDQNLITLRDSENLPGLLRRKGIKETMFTEWFALNDVDIEARKYTYAEIPSHYVWNAKEKAWRPRIQGNCIGRMMYSHPTSGERYYLRMLLNVVKGPRSFEEMKTVNGKVFNTFKEACYALGMINDDKEWTDAIIEVRLWASGVQLRELFGTILLFCEVNNPQKLWEQNWEALSEDILHKKRKQFKFPDLQLTEEQLKNYCLLHIQEILNRSGRSLADYDGMPLPNPTLLTNADNRLIQEELNYNYTELAREQQSLYASLNTEQRLIYDHVISAIQDDKEGFFFVYGPGGTGKTFLYKALLARLRSERKIVLAVASSGMASLLLPGGRTAHSRFVIPLELMDNSTCGIKQNTHLAELMHEVKLIIWDEAPMTQKYAFEALDRTLKDILGANDERNRRKLFGGVIVLLGGDFRQILLVITKGKRQDIVQASINNSQLWKHYRVLKLSRSMRVNEFDGNGCVDLYKQQFNKWVLKVGDGIVSATARDGEDEPSWSKIPDEFIIRKTECPLEEMITQVFPNFIERQAEPNYLRERAILTPLNEDADMINSHMFEKLNGVIKTYRSSDEICKASTDIADQDQMFPVEFLNALQFPGMPPHSLKLKEGLPVMLLRNVNPSQGLCNGTRLIISHLGEWVIEASIITGNNIGRKVLIPRITLTSPKSKWPFILKRTQFPIRPCYAMTINKSQGQSLNVVGIYLPKPVFCHGQLYVAISRVTDPKGLKIYLKEDTGEYRNHTRNIVFKEAFTNLISNHQEWNMPEIQKTTTQISRNKD